ncbi:MAG TPA: mechanosensitive ion channel [Firmicutes bacterium]|nr:mechanosensitive ion channel [Bacillota bacterium]
MTFDDLSTAVSEIWNLKLLSVGEGTLTVGLILSLFLGLIIVWIIAGFAQRLLVSRMLKRTHLDDGSKSALGRLGYYIILVLGVFLVLDTVGLKISSLAFLGGLIGIGIGFGMQNIASNFISGLILLLERPIRAGDVVDINGDMGVVEDIKLRTTHVRTFNNILLLVPNADLISTVVKNWSSEDMKVRGDVTVGVSYNSDPRKVEEILLRLAQEHENTMEDPASTVAFLDFGNSSLDFVVRFWVPQPSLRVGTESDLRYRIFEAFKQEGIEIPFPQHDLHIRASDAALPIENRNAS